MIDKLKGALASLKSELVDIWERSKMVLLTIAGLVVALEFRAIYEWALAYINGKQVKAAENKDDKLKAQESALSQQADALVADAKALPTQEKPVSADWYRSEDGK